MMMPEKVKDILKHQHYAIIGKHGHSAVQICRWTKNSLRNQGSCYKEKFYGIKSHLCCQMSPYLACPNMCVHCWRPIELDTRLKLAPESSEIDNPKEIIDKCIRAQQILLSGFGGSEKVNKTRLKQAQEPMQFAISLIGEPTLYPKLAELIKELRKRGKTSFLVTNGLFPDRLKELKNKKALPTQLYISLNYPNKKLFRKITKNKNKKAWEKLNQSLELMRDLKTRKVIRLTLVRELNIDKKYAKDYAELVKKANPDFIEVKGYISVGFARKRLGYERMPSHEEIKDFAKEILKYIKDYKLLDEKKESKVVLLGKDRKKMKIRKG